MRIKKLGIAAVVLGLGLVTVAATPAAAATEAFTFAGVADWDRDGNQDIVVRQNSNGDLWLYPGESTRAYSSQQRVKIGNGWNGYTFAGVADYDRDGNQDIVVRNDANGDLWLYPGQSVRGYSTLGRYKIGNGWNGYTFAGLADYDRDGHVDIVTRNDANGDLWLYPGESVRGYSSQQRVKIGNGWNGYAFAGLSDWDRDGHVDILTRSNANGDLWLYPGESVRGYSSQQRVKIGNGWNGYTVGGLSDYDRDGSQDIVVRNDSSHDLWLYPGQSVRAYSTVPPVKIGNGW
jgi:hypothetical protein